MGKSKHFKFNNTEKNHKRIVYLIFYFPNLWMLKFCCTLQIQILYSLCPQEGHQGMFKMDQRGQDSIIALGIYLLESNFQHVEHILPYLLKLLHSLGKMQWVDEIKYFSRESLFILFF